MDLCIPEIRDCCYPDTAWVQPDFNFGINPFTLHVDCSRHVVYVYKSKVTYRSHQEYA